jgi:hypothetical protein
MIKAVKMLTPRVPSACVHRWGWQIRLHPDGTTTAVGPDRKRVLHSHAPPTAA